MELLRITLDSGQEALPVFSFEDEARVFLRLGVFGSDWRPRETATGELISVLYSLCAGVDSVVLDPLPVPFAGSNDLLSMRREAFMAFALEQDRVVPSVSITSADPTWQRMQTRSHTKNGRERRSIQRVSDARAFDVPTRTATLEKR